MASPTPDLINDSQFAPQAAVPLAGSVTNASVANNAAIAFSKLAALTSGNILVGSAGNVATSVAMSGDATIVASGAITIANDAVTTAKILDANVTAAKVADTAGTGTLAVKKQALVVYDFAVDGGTQGTFNLTGSPTIPDNAVVWLESYDVLTTCTSATDAATIALALTTDGAITTAIAISDASNPFDAGVFVGTQGALATPLPKKTTAARTFQLTIAGGEDVTAGKIVFQVAYWVSQ